MKTEYAFSYNSEDYTTEFYETVDLAIAAAWAGDDTKTKCWVGEVYHHTAREFLPDADDIIDLMYERANDNACDAAESYLNGISQQIRRDITPHLQNAIMAVFETHAVDVDPDFFSVLNAQEFTKPEEQTDGE